MVLKHWAIALLIWCLSTGSVMASGESPTPLNSVKERIDQIIEILNDPSYQAPGQKERQRDKIWEISQPMFDFKEISRRTVGPKWDAFSDEEKAQFTNVFAEFLGNTYIDKIQGEYHNEQIVYLKELVKELYQSPVLSFIFALVMIVFTIPYLALQPMAAGYALEELVGLPYFNGCIIVTAVILIYTLRGNIYRNPRYFLAARGPALWVNLFLLMQAHSYKYSLNALSDNPKHRGYNPLSTRIAGTRKQPSILCTSKNFS